MNKLILLLVCVGVMAAGTQDSDPSSKTKAMKFNAGIITAKIAESKQFYTKNLGFTIRFESDWFLLLESPSGDDQISFLQPGHESQQPVFQDAFAGKGVYITIEVEDVDSEYARIRKLGVPIVVPIRDEPWGDRHFAIMDPNGVGVDIVRFTPPAN